MSSVNSLKLMKKMKNIETDIYFLKAQIGTYYEWINSIEKKIMQGGARNGN